MECPSCGKASRSGARFCSGCGSSLALRCPACGAEAEAGAQFCDACGARLVAARPADETGARKVVTIVFADLIGSTALHERLDAESTRGVMERYYRTLRAPIEAHGGRVVQLLGDGVLAAFGVPRVAEDDAIRAVRAAVAMQQAFHDLAGEQAGLLGGLRVAINTGEVVVSPDQAEIVGDPINVAARLQQEGGDGDVLIGESTRRLVGELVTLAPLGTFALKGRAERVPAYRVVSLERPAGVAAIPFVGRDDELRRLEAAYDSAVTTPAGRLAVVLGSPGLGKSRLVGEFARRLGDAATVLSASCDAAGGATFAPLARALRAYLRVADGAGTDDVRAAAERAVAGDDAERARIAGGIAALLSDTPAAPEETFFVVRRFLTALATTRPVVLMIDDLHWAEPMLLDLVEHLVQWSGGVPLLVLGAARPELRDVRAQLAVPGGTVSAVVTLTGLDAGAATRLAANVIGADALPAAVAGRVLAASEGNPLFVGELVRMLVDDGTLRREGDRWTVDAELASLEMPPTIHALLAARIERLRPDERVVIERAAVVGRQFSRTAVAHLLPAEAQGDLDARLEALRRSELVEPDTSWFLGEPALRFHHALVRDAAYRRVLKGTRAELHARVAEWILVRAGEAQHDETIGWHLEQAHQNLRELGPLDERGRALGERAARHLAAAGRRALARDDVRVAATLLARALDRLDGADPARAELALDWCEALLAAGDVDPAESALAELGRFTSGSERLRAWHVCFAGQLAVLTDPTSLHATAEKVAVAAEALSAAGDTAGEAKAHSVHALALQRLGKIGACEAALDRALAAARRAHDRRRANTVLAGAPVAALWGPSPVTRASGRCLDVVRVLRITQGAPAVEAVALRCQAVLEALRGRIDAARRMIGSSRRMLEDLGISNRLLEADVFAGLIDLLEGDAPAAERRLRGAYEGLRENGLAIDAAQAAAYLGRALLAQDRAAEAERISEEGEALAGDDLQAAIAWRGVRAEALARRGERVAAIDLARAAVELAAGTDALLHHANARMALATALRASGRDPEADVEERRAIELWESKGATLLAEQARRRTGNAAPAPPSAESPAPARPIRRRVRTNDAITYAARLEAVMAARDSDALSSLFDEDFEYVDHPAGLETGRDGIIETFARLIQASDSFVFRNEPLAALGDSLGLYRGTISVPGIVLDGLPFGALETEFAVLTQTNGSGRAVRSEVFAADKLGDAIARLYERHAALLPDGPEKTLATSIARTVAAMLGPPDLDRWAAVFAPDVELVDLRNVGFETQRGADAVRRAIGVLFALAEDLTARVDDVLGLRPDALLVSWTMTGIDRASGGTFARSLCLALSFGADGRLTRSEQTDVSRADEALARFVDASGIGSPGRFVHRVRPNLASQVQARLAALFAARDTAALEPFFGDLDEAVDHATGTILDAGGMVVAWRALFEASGAWLRGDTVATLGDRLALVHGWMSFAALAGDNDLLFGAVDREEYVIIETDAAGRLTRLEQNFATNHLADAVARFYQRHADLLPDGPEKTRAAATARTVAAMLQAVPGLLLQFLAPDVEFADHRPLGMEPLRGAEALARVHETQHELAEDLAIRIDEVVALEPDACLLRWTTTGRDRAGGGTFERRLLMLRTFDADGLLARVEWFDPDRDAEALVRFDALVGSPAPCIENAATRCMVRFQRAWEARDWAVASIHAPDFRLVDRRTIVQLDVDREQHLRGLRSMFDVESSRFTLEPIATRDDRLALARARFESAGRSVGPAKSEWLQIVGVDDCGDCSAMVVFDAGDLDAAYGELDRRHAAGEAAIHGRISAVMRSFTEGFARRDWKHLAALFAPDLVVNDRRRLGWQTLRGPRAYVESLRSLVDLAPDTRLRLDHVRVSDRGLLWVGAWQGTRDGGSFETPWIVVSEHDAVGLVHRFDQYDLDQLAVALAHFAALTSAPAGSPLVETVATRSLRRFERAWDTRDWEAIGAALGPSFRQIDRRGHSHVELDRAQHLERTRAVFDLRPSRLTSEVIATRGDRLVLARLRIEATNGAIPPGEAESLGIVEVDEHGDRVALVRFDPDDVDAAYAELRERYATGEGGPWGESHALMHAFGRAVTLRDWTALAALFAPGFEVRDHGPLGRLVLDGAGLVDTMRSLVDDFARDADFRFNHVWAAAGSTFSIVTWRGTRDGGAFESPRVVVAELDARGLVQSFDFYGLDQMGEARARFDELRARVPGDPLAAFARPNEATAARDRLQAAFDARDWAALRAMFAPDAKFHDRRAHVRITLDVEAWVANAKQIAQHDEVHLGRVLVGTAGPRVSLERFTWSSTSDSSAAEFAFGDPSWNATGPFVLEYLGVVESDERGRIAGSVAFDLDDRPAAFREMVRRWIAQDPRAAAVLGPPAELSHAIETGDLHRVRAAIADDVVVTDHRATRLGVIEGADAYVTSIATVHELASKVSVETPFVVALEPHGGVAVVRASGTLRDGGTYENPLLSLATVAGGRVTRLELFEIEEVDAAIARLAALRPDPLRIPPSAATRACDRFAAAFATRDWEVLRAIIAPAAVYEDRRRSFLVAGDRDMMLANFRAIGPGRTRLERTVLATAGDRLVLERRLWTGMEGEFEVESLELTEVDAEGRAVALIVFDPDDRRAAGREMFERYYAGDAGGSPQVALARALNAHDLARLRAVLPADFHFHDHRRTGVGRIGNADDYVASIAALFEQSPDVTFETLYLAAVHERGALAVARMFGTLVDGGAFESVFLRIIMHRGGRVVGAELFELEDMERARARFDELCTAPTGHAGMRIRIRPNAATRASDRWHAAGAARDWKVLGDLYAPDIVYEDRRAGLRTTADRDTLLASNQFTWAEGSFASPATLATAGDRLALRQLDWTLRDPQGRLLSEVELLEVVEVDGHGRVVAVVHFDAADRRAASLEMNERYYRRGPLWFPVALEAVRAMNAHDPARIRATMGDGFVLHDHRRTGVGRIDGADAFVASLAPLFEQAPDLVVETLYTVATGSHGELCMGRMSGTLAAGGGAFESVYLRILVWDGERGAGMELFEPEDLGLARARFEELGRKSRA